MARSLLVLAASALLLPLSSTAAYSQEEPGPDATISADLLEVLVTPTGPPEQVSLGVPDTIGDDGELGELLRNCFTIAGIFDVFGPETLYFDPSTTGVDAINGEAWTNMGATGVVNSAVESNGDVDLRLFDVATESEIDVGWQATGDARDSAYEFVNLVIEYYTGTAGFFGTSILIQNDLEIYRVGADGSGLSAITSNGSINTSPSWGPGGEALYMSYVGGGPDLYLGDSPLVANEGLDMGAQLRPGGGEIVMSSSYSGNSEIYVVDTSGDELRRCTTNSAEDISPTWSPDGDRIAFVSDRSGGPQIYVMNADCSGQRRVTFAGSYNTSPDWSPSGDMIAFTGRDSRNRFDIFAVEVDTGYIVRLTQDQGDNEEPSWSPDGNYLVFSSTRGGSERLYVSTADGHFQTCITPNGSGYSQPAWQR